MGKQVTEYVLYRWRYILGYSIVGLGVIGLLTVAGLWVPGGITQSEMQSTITSDALSTKVLSPDIIVNLPYHLLQRVGFELLGVTSLTIKLPSLILGALSAMGILILLQMWFRRNVAVITAVVGVTAGYFLFLSQSGTPNILYIFWPVWLLIAALMTSRSQRFGTMWKILLFVIAALSLYTPLSLYVLIALASATIFHPHLRYLLRQINKVRLAAGIIVGLLVMAPLIVAIVLRPGLALTLLGIPSDWHGIGHTAITSLRQYFDFIHPVQSTVIAPIYKLGSILLILLGITQFFATRYTARSYIITAWIVLLTPVLLLRGDYASVTFVPFLLLIAAGVDSLIRRWYQLFPNNPYARIAGLVPLSILIGGMTISGALNYVGTYRYNPQTVKNFSHDLTLVHKQLAASKSPLTLVVTEKEAPFYAVVAHHSKKLLLSKDMIQQRKSDVVMVQRDLRTTGLEPAEIVTNHLASDADRFYIYKFNAN